MKTLQNDSKQEIEIKINFDGRFSNSPGYTSELWEVKLAKVAVKQPTWAIFQF